MSPKYINFAPSPVDDSTIVVNLVKTHSDDSVQVRQFSKFKDFLVTLIMGSCSPKSKQFVIMSQHHLCASLVKI